MPLSLAPIDPGPIKEKSPKDSLVIRSCKKDTMEAVLNKDPDDYRKEYIALVKFHLKTDLSKGMKEKLEKLLDKICNEGDKFIEEQKISVAQKVKYNPEDYPKEVK